MIKKTEKILCDICGDECLGEADYIKKYLTLPHSDGRHEGISSRSQLLGYFTNIYKAKFFLGKMIMGTISSIDVCELCADDIKKCYEKCNNRLK